MASWPWTKDLSVAIADPIPPVDPEDTRPSVKDLIAKHRAAIDEVANELRSHILYDANKHDDLWILRFCMSHKKTKKAVKAAKSTMEFRKEHRLDEKDIRFVPGTVDQPDIPEVLKRYLTYCGDDGVQFTLPDSKRGVVAFIKLDSLQQQTLLKVLSSEEWLIPYLYLNEWSHQWLDYVTRTTGRLTKSIRCMDLQTTQLSDICIQANRRDGDAMAVMEDVYPQLLQTLYICGAPSYIQIPWRILKPLLPKRVVSKIDFINPDKSTKERDIILGYIDIQHLPVRFGGSYELWPVSYPLPSRS